MTDTEIKKAFEICYVSDEDCSGCPFCDEDGECTDIGDSNLCQDVLDLIHRQQAEIDGLIAGQETLQKCIADKMAEIEKLKKDIQESDILIDMQDNVLREQTELIEQLQDENKSIRYCYEQAKSYNDRLAESCEKNCKKFNMTTRADAIKEFAERLKEKAELLQTTDYFDPCIVRAVRISVIDNLVKEMAGEKDV